MATQRLSMRQTREILRQRLLLHRSYREIGRSLGVSVGAAANAVARAQAQGLEWPAVQVLTDAALEAYLYRRADLPPRRPADPRLRVSAHRTAQSRRHARAVAPGIPGATPHQRLPLHSVLRLLSALVGSPPPHHAPDAPRWRETVRGLLGQEAELHRSSHRGADLCRTLRRRASVRRTSRTRRRRGRSKGLTGLRAISAHSRFSAARRPRWCVTV